MTKKIMIQIITAVFIFSLIAASGFSAEKEGAHTGSKNQTGQSSMGGMDGSHHENINSGRDFGQHVKEMNEHFSGTHNPGRHHKGYSGIKDK